MQEMCALEVCLWALDLLVCCLGTSKKGRGVLNWGCRGLNTLVVVFGNLTRV